jgi:hypothetical protein
MAHERLRNSGLTQALTDLLADLADLLRKELQLAKTEITEKIATGPWRPHSRGPCVPGRPARGSLHR